MELFILIVVLVILTETSMLLVAQYKPIKQTRRKIYVDTSALIDGRVLDIAKTGFIDGDLIVLRSVLLELQLLADGKDSEKRARARAGLEVVSELERVPEVNTEIFDDGDLGRKKVDEELLKMAKLNRGTLLTIDYNLLKVADAEKIPTLNINDLALAVRSEVPIGSRQKVRITGRGSARGQGVGHLKDGTLVVVDKASTKIGNEVTVEVVNTHETSAGRMVFAKILKG